MASSSHSRQKFCAAPSWTCAAALGLGMVAVGVLHPWLKGFPVELGFGRVAWTELPFFGSPDRPQVGTLFVLCWFLHMFCAGTQGPGAETSVDFLRCVDWVPPPASPSAVLTPAPLLGVWATTLCHLPLKKSQLRHHGGPRMFRIRINIDTFLHIDVVDSHCRCESTSM